MPHEIKAFQCDYCHRAFARMVDAVNHETACRFNPKLRYCCTCKYQTKKSRNLPLQIIRLLQEKRFSPRLALTVHTLI